ncbi:MAG: tRNA (adenosine(37)-N6)-threonylcarbamoyltransferase complex dimerization subunit type 1 TsaB [Methylotenera sp.]|nr:tRNA (adenosine(37)-N6)-threonylcarbamoyltransferase complex dimerization subunit type 1 TsaB [Methylotenera sp.]MDO9231953.1 tRNA (adenosine(37)-N6)-threonylcarbamoyltransferase complex dimerization subunit type 1 TsaB [Methylotenera sp.]MDO9388494.1 tRNA (adenosine(37)-N6)-threonylcarbamoyltransferase complex dimerization subunit type 1 TsaB [Methylotenera sp.]MDP2102367.1 tRNA (adenosine(37)-N6)-threonylcarbamoyltransferase complex dimerization subunit type 1 TsaB [Methylotenera sp.]MDP22
MNLLAFDTSTEYLSLALMRGGAIFTFDTLAGQTHSQIILPQIQTLLNEAGLQLHDLNGIAFGAGPGSFTGVRIAAGVAQGLGLGANLPVVGVCTLMALAEASGATKVVACLDARMGEVYHAVYVKNSIGWQTIVEPGLYKPDAVPVVEGRDWVGAGSGWQVYSEVLSTACSGKVEIIQPALLPTAEAILKLAQPVFTSGEAKSASEAMPIYIRNRVALKTSEREQGLKL